MTRRRDQVEPKPRAAPQRNRNPLIRTKDDRRRFVAQLLAQLPGPEEDPVSTVDLGDYYQLGPYERSSLLWTSLSQLARAGLVQRVVQAGEIVRYWRRAPAGDKQAASLAETQ